MGRWWGRVGGGGLELVRELGRRGGVHSIPAALRPCVWPRYERWARSGGSSKGSAPTLPCPSGRRAHFAGRAHGAGAGACM